MPQAHGALAAWLEAQKLEWNVSQLMYSLVVRQVVQIYPGILPIDIATESVKSGVAMSLRFGFGGEGSSSGAAVLYGYCQNVALWCYCTQFHSFKDGYRRRVVLIIWMVTLLFCITPKEQAR